MGEGCQRLTVPFPSSLSPHRHTHTHTYTHALFHSAFELKCEMDKILLRRHAKTCNSLPLSMSEASGRFPFVRAELFKMHLRLGGR